MTTAHFPTVAGNHGKHNTHRHTKGANITWLELAVLTQRQRQDGEPVLVHPLILVENKPHFAMTLNRRWLCGGDGALTVFDSTAAASRFLQLLKVDRHAIEECCDCEVPKHSALQCFQLGPKGLAGATRRKGEPTLRQTSGRHF
jgi:hypothetical protein